MNSFRLALCIFMSMSASLSFAAQGVVTLVAAGDVEWSGKFFEKKSESVFYDPGEKTLLEGGWMPIPRLISSETMDIVGKDNPDILRRHREMSESAQKVSESYLGYSGEQVAKHYAGRKFHELSFSSESEAAIYPFRKVADTFRKADIAFINLESPMSDNAPKVGAFRTPSSFRQGLVEAGIDVISLANNHMMDAQVWGLYETLENLDEVGIHHVGAGKDLAQARQPFVVEKHGVKIAILAYSQVENSGISGFATASNAGVAPMDPLLIKEDIKRIKPSVDHVILSFHWDIFAFDAARSFDLHPDAVSFAHDMIDAGADAILGHHPHVPRAVEYYKGKPILYSMGNLIFGMGLPSWIDNYVARLNITKKSISSVEILPVAGVFSDLAQPYFLEGQRAKTMLNNLKHISKEYGGKLRIEGDKGILTSH